MDYGFDLFGIHEQRRKRNFSFKPISLLSLFSGIGAFEKALDNIGIKYNLIAYCEIDPNASKAYNAIHGTTDEDNLVDVRNIKVEDLPKDIDLLTYGFPCQDISLAGRKKGFWESDNKETNSGLFFEALRIIRGCRPKIAIAENVKALTSDKFKAEFNAVLEGLDNAGYNNYWKILNAKDYGIPQSRERLFIVSIRKDIDNNFFEFPTPCGLQLYMKDFLEKDVSSQYTVTQGITNLFIRKSIEEKLGYNCKPHIQDKAEIAFTITTRRDRCTENFIVLDGVETDKSYISLDKDPFDAEKFKMRYLTPLECYRLMGFSDSDYKKASRVIKQRFLYKTAGNSIVVNVLEELFNMIFDKNGNFLV